MLKKTLYVVVVFSSFLAISSVYADVPVAVGCNVTVPAGKGLVADVGAVDVDCGSHDPDGDTVTLSLNPAGPYPIGDTTVTLTATDELGDADSTTAVITVLPTAYSYKETAVMILNSLVAPDNLIQVAINTLMAGMDDACWDGPDGLDTRHVQAKGTEAFGPDVIAINLLDATDQDEAKAIDMIVAADSICCDTAIANAAFRGINVTEAKVLRNEGRAAEFLGFSSLAVSKYGKAVTKTAKDQLAHTTQTAQKAGAEVEPVKVAAISNPEVCTYAPRQITSTSAVFKGCILDDGGQPCKYRFAYKAEGGPVMTTNWEDNEDEDEDDEDDEDAPVGVVGGEIVHLRIDGLNPATTYNYVLEAKNDAGMDIDAEDEDGRAFGSKGTFTTLP